MLKNLLLILFALLLYRFGTFVPIPGIDYGLIRKIFSSDEGFISTINLFSGGGLERMSIFALNIIPYITASIVMQLLISSSKNLSSLKGSGIAGVSKINRYTKLLSLVIAVFQAVGIYHIITRNDGIYKSDYIFRYLSLFLVVSTLVTGVILLMWLGERITKLEFGNGTSIIIFFGIASSLPSSFFQIFSFLKRGVYDFPLLALGILVVVLAILCMCFVERSFRKIKIINSSYRGSNILLSDKLSFIPIKINPSGVIPPIFANALIALPAIIFEIFNLSESGPKLFIWSSGSPYNLIVVSVMIVFFSYSYSEISLNPKEISEGLKKNNCFVVGVRPGVQTLTYLRTIILRMSFFGGVYLVISCGLFDFIVARYAIPFYIGGTGIMILISVAMEVLSNFRMQIEKVSLRSRSHYRKKRKIVRL